MSLPLPINLDSPDWVLKSSSSWIAQLTDPETNTYTPIPEQIISVPFSSPILAITAATIDNVSFAKFGYIRQIKSLGINQNAVVGARKIWRGTQLIRFSEDYSGNYLLTFKPFYRLHHVSILIYEFQ
ncbi:hypothetical protein C7H19_09480 [Aphanothece hegewaldii CCALA 016]|uniref:Uncharacterized protein n=1 Tax=Aphanothece hegewaldii CCALA 016 TaxID=2107694 RepID=A0A2T1LZD4_9CHRO|nr:hypothetical protein [Aphanothece hegewaldii]PSF37764.1 hypothetical protein C7H19_09480 [Aphanothece hegewaldii CCALA 016]